MNDGKKIRYRFYRRSKEGKDRRIRSLIEKRKDPQRITNASIMNYIKQFAREDVLNDRVYFVRVES